MKSVLVDKAENFDSDLIKTQDTFEKIIENMINISLLTFIVFLF